MKIRQRNGELETDMFNDKEHLNDFRYYNGFEDDQERARAKAKDFRMEHVQWASDMKFLFLMRDVQTHCSNNQMQEPKVSKNIVTSVKTLETHLANEARMKHTNEEGVDNESTNVWLIGDDFKWVWGANQKTQEEQVYSWYFLAADFYFPRANRIYTVALAQCISAFSKPQIMNITSWVKDLLMKKKDYKLKDLKIPKYLQQASCLVGAPKDGMKKKELEELKDNPPDVAKGWIYPEVRYHYVHAKLNDI